ncbi:MAG: hypothetical protein AAFR36_33050 [Bacteroidota bacterium]
MEQLFETKEFEVLPLKSTPNFYFKIEQLIPWSESEMIQDEISLDEVVLIAGVYDFSKTRVEKLILANKYNKEYNPSIDRNWIRLTKVFTS